jgi:endonuclease-3
MATRRPPRPPLQPVDPAWAAAVHRALVALYGPRPWPKGDDPLDELIGTILSQSTTDTNSGRAFKELRARFPTWMEVLEAPTGEVYEAIKGAGLGAIKAPRIQDTLAEILRRTGALSLDFLADMPLDEARAWLRSLHGIGPKTAACVLMFALNRPALPVDTHVYRVSRRIGLIGERVNPEQSHALLEAAIPPQDIYSFHVLMIRHGRQVCHAIRPRCNECALRPLCDYGRSARSVDA